jgi:4-hydroxy-tetrahydrodipicolinate synthase
MFTGCGTALVTPFRGRSLDEETLRKLVRRQIERASISWCPAAPPARAPRSRAPSTCAWSRSRSKKRAARSPVLAGAGGYNTHEVIELAQSDEEALGADGILSVTPYYNKPTQEGLYQHYKAIAAPSACPIVVYSVQGRTGVNVEPATLKRLAEIENIVGVKEASGNIGADGRT